MKTSKKNSPFFHTSRGQALQSGEDLISQEENFLHTLRAELPCQ
jgi:hypothetical protein